MSRKYQTGQRKAKAALFLAGLALLAFIGGLVWLMTADIPSPARTITHELTDGTAASTHP
ncbi:MAG: hypothetical protein J0L97_09900 [Alphaproteobacteria bacterium]|nr:hypothetical protein [Alphaproteobacteria bacterium]